jgi:hypothetical protein
MKTFLMLVGIALLAGCAVRTPSASVSVGTGWGFHDGYYHDRYYRDYYYEDDYYRGGHGHGRFCPPGQAKKGNC